MRHEADEMEMRLFQAAYAWWRMNRPLAWSEAEHLESPAINCRNQSETALAAAVAAQVRRLGNDAV